MFVCFPGLSCWHVCMLHFYVTIAGHFKMNLIFYFTKITSLFTHAAMGLGSLKGLVICGDQWPARLVLLFAHSALCFMYRVFIIKYLLIHNCHFRVLGIG